MENDYLSFEDRDIFDYIPYRIELHKYNQFKKQKKGGFLEFINYNLIDEFQIEYDTKIMSKIIEKFPSLLFFDGLDEVFDIQERLQVRNDIENFIRQHSKVKSIVTSRFESYEEVKLDKKIYTTLTVNDFSTSQIKEYVEKWYNIEEESTKVKIQEIKDCLNQLTSVDNQLKHNPLLLALILILYRNEKDLPTSKLEIYEGCAQTLIEHRDKKEKKLDLQLKISHKISVFSNLAYWQFNIESSKKELKIDHNSVLRFIQDYLINKGEFDDLNIAREAAEQFLEYAKIRSIYFENKFTHKTFYEYFTANYIFSNYYSKPGGYNSFLKLLEKNIGLSSWAVILELLICSIDKGQIEYEVIDNITEYLLKIKPYETYGLFLTTMPHLRTMSPAKTKIILTEIIDYISNLSLPIENRKALLDKFLSLIQFSKFKIIALKIIKEGLQDKNKSQYFNLIIELQFIEKDFKNIILEYEEKFGNSEKYFIISNKLNGVYERTKNFNLFKIYLEKFEKKSVFKYFISDFDLQTTFDGTFNWISVLMSQVKTASEATNLYNRLKELNIKKEEILRVLEGQIKNIHLDNYYFINDVQLSRKFNILKHLAESMQGKLDIK